MPFITRTKEERTTSVLTLVRLRASSLLADERDKVPGGGVVAADGPDRRPQHMLVVVEEPLAEVSHADRVERHLGRRRADGLGVHHVAGRRRLRGRGRGVPLGEVSIYLNGDLLHIGEQTLDLAAHGLTTVAVVDQSAP